MRSLINNSIDASGADNKLYLDYKNGQKTVVKINATYLVPNNNESTRVVLEMSIKVNELDLDQTAADRFHSDLGDTNGAKIYEYKQGLFKVVRGESEKVNLCMDMKYFSLGKNDIFRFVETCPDEIVDYDSFEILNPELILPDVTAWDIDILQMSEE